METGALPPGFSRESTIRRDAEGRWFHDGEPVENVAVARAFDRWIDRADDGRYRLKNEVNWVYVTIEGAPIFVRGVAKDGGALLLELSDGKVEPLDVSTLRQDEAGVLHVEVRDRTLPARFTRRAQQQIEPFVEEDELGPYLALGVVRARPPVVTDPLSPSSWRDAQG